MDDKLCTRLNTLRQITNLSPEESVKVFATRKKTGSETFPNYTYADALEYTIRFREYQGFVEPVWQGFSEMEKECFSLYEFAEQALDEYIEERSRVRTR